MDFTLTHSPTSWLGKPSYLKKPQQSPEDLQHEE